MADNITAPGTGAVLATKEIGAVHHPLSILADTSGNEIDGTNRLPVELSAATLTALETTELGAATLAALGTTELGATTLAALENITATVTGVATAANQTAQTAAIDALAGGEYEAVAASAATQPLGTTGAVGDLLSHLIIIPATTSPGAVAIKDGAGAAITVFAGGATSVGSLVPFNVAVGALSTLGAWQVTTGANVSVVAVGRFS